VRALLCRLLFRSAWVQPATVVAGASGEGAALHSVPSVGVGQASHCGGGKKVEGAALATVRLIGEAQPATVLAGTTDKGAALDSSRLFGVGSGSHCGGGHDRLGHSSGLCSLGLLGHRQLLWRWERQVRALLWPLNAWSAWVHPATVVASMNGEGDALAYVYSVGVGSANLCGGGHVR
jgi:hypothetical protein